MKRIGILTVLALVSLMAKAQIQYPYILNPPTVAPSGSCAGPQIQVLGSNGAIYSCNNGTWGLASGGGTGTVTSVTGTANQIDVATGTTTPVISLDPSLILPAGTTGLPVATGISGLGTGVATALAVNVGSAGAPVTNGGALGTPSAGVITNLTGTCSACTANSATSATTATTATNATNVANTGAVSTNAAFFPLFVAANTTSNQPTNTAVGLSFNPSLNSLTISGSFNAITGVITGKNWGSATNCAGVGTAASPSVVTCSAASVGAFSCATNASGTTCQVNTTAVLATSEIFVQEVADEGTRLGVTCNTAPTANAAPLLATKAVGNFTINMPTITSNPACFDFWVIN